MSDYWQAAERVASGAPAAAAPRPVSRFEADPGAADSGDFERIEPLGKDTAAPPPPAARTEAPVAAPAEPKLRPEADASSPIRIERLTVDEPIAEAAPPSPRHELPTPPPAAPPVHQRAFVEAPARAPDETPPRAVVSTSEPSPSTPPNPVPGSLVVERVTERLSVERGADEEPRKTIVTALPPMPVLRPPEPRPPEAPAGSVAPVAPPPHPAPLTIQIDRIEIRLDPPAAPVAPPKRERPAAPIDLNAYLARRTS